MSPELKKALALLAASYYHGEIEEESRMDKKTCDQPVFISDAQDRRVMEAQVELEQNKMESYLGLLERKNNEEVPSLEKVITNNVRIAFLELLP